MDVSIILESIFPEGVWRPTERFDDVIAKIKLAEDLGCRAAWIAEHHAHRCGRASLPAVLSFAAAQTRTIRLGTAVCVLPLHHPMRLAEDLATVDHLSKGRLEIGLGRGLFPKEFEAFGIAIDEREARFDECLQVMLKCWTTDKPFHHDGDFYYVGNAIVNPPPYQQPHPPLYMASISAPSIEKCVRLGLHGFVGAFLVPIENNIERSFKPWQKYKAQYQQPQLRCVHNEVVYVADDRAKALAMAKEPVMDYIRGAGATWIDADIIRDFMSRDEWPPGYETLGPVAKFFQTAEWPEVQPLIIAGSAAEVAAQVQKLVDAGIDELMIFDGGGLEYTHMQRSLGMFMEKVLPQTRPAAAATVQS